MSRKGKSIEIESMLLVAKGWDVGTRVTSNGHEGLFSCDRNVLNLDCEDGCTTLSIY